MIAAHLKDDEKTIIDRGFERKGTYLIFILNQGVYYEYAYWSSFNRGREKKAYEIYGPIFRVVTVLDYIWDSDAWNRTLLYYVYCRRAYWKQLDTCSWTVACFCKSDYEQIRATWYRPEKVEKKRKMNSVLFETEIRKAFGTDVSPAQIASESHF